LLDAFKKAFADYEEKMKKLAITLEDEAYHLQQVAEHCNQVSAECLAVGNNIREIDSY
jgi:hypothetical protein